MAAILIAAAGVAELADAQASGACELRLVEVRLLSSAVPPQTGLFEPLIWPQQAKLPTI